MINVDKHKFRVCLTPNIIPLFTGFYLNLSNLSLSKLDEEIISAEGERVVSRRGRENGFPQRGESLREWFPTEGETSEYDMNYDTIVMTS